MYNSERDMIWSAGGRFNTFFTLAPTRGYREKDIGQYDTQTEMDWISCCAFLIRSEVLTKIGLEDEIFFYGCFDDVDLSLRVRKVGYKLFYYPQSVIYHDVMSAALSEGRTGGNIKPFFHYLVTRNHWFFIRKHTPLLYLPSSIVYQLIKFFAYSVNFVLRCRFVKFRAFMHGFIHGIVQPLESEKLKHEKYILKYR